MKIVIAPDSFKENLSSMEVATAIEQGIRRVIPKARIVKIPMADGGEGTVQALVGATGGRLLRKTVTGPLGEPVKARYGFLGDGTTAVIEMAEASGLPLVPREQRNPLLTTTYGTGELIRDAIKRGARKVLIGIGGSATTDGGAGMAQALGVQFRLADGSLLKDYAAGRHLSEIADIDMSGIDPRVASTEIVVACDVDNPLYGKRGAAWVFGPQKGATPGMVEQLDAGLRSFGALMKKTLRVDVRKLEGAGAAGGLGAALVAFCGAQLRSGVDIVLEATRLADHIKGADLVITGEGRVDFQTAFGKTPSGVARAARRHRVPVVAIGGGLADDARGVFDHGIDALEAATAREMPLAQALANAATYLADAGERVVRLILIGERIATKSRRRA